jgi:hypothetical protein
MERCAFCAIARAAGEKTPVCTAGVNFYALGPAQAPCRSCPLPQLVRGPVCQYLVAYTWLRGACVEAALQCDRPAHVAPNEMCQFCPVATGPGSWPERRATSPGKQ